MKHLIDKYIISSMQKRTLKDDSNFLIPYECAEFH